MTTKRFSIAKIKFYVEKYMVSIFLALNPHEVIRKDPELASMMQEFKKNFNNMISFD